MNRDAFRDSPLPVREDLAEAHEQAWSAVARPGTWLDGGRRVAVAAEIRRARDCAHCVALRAALSPNALRGEHDHGGVLDTTEVELVHRLVNDPGRLSESWATGLLDAGLGDGEYVEIVGLVASVMIMDTCTRALGLPDRPLPEPRPGAPSRYRPPGARKEAAWLPLTEPEDAVAADGPMYPSPKAGYIYRGLSLVPQSLRDYWAMASAHYLPGEVVYRMGETIRAISRVQQEVIAARVSALHECAY